MNKSGRPIGDTTQPTIGQVRPGFFLNREGLGFFRSLFSLKGHTTSH